MDVILTTDVENLGRAGDVVTVKAGYGRNYLLPKGLALVATKGNVAQLEHHKRAIAAEQARRREEQEKHAAALKGAEVSIPRKVGQDDKLFGSVTSKDIAEALAAQNIAVDRKLIQLAEPIKAVGAHKVNVRFSADVQVELSVTVIGLK
jgi:large subunit ribosomal protein L9